MVGWIRWGLITGFHLSFKCFAVRGFWVVLLYIMFDIVAVSLTMDDGTAHWAHIGGLVWGIIIAFGLLTRPSGLLPQRHLLPGLRKIRLAGPGHPCRPHEINHQSRDSHGVVFEMRLRRHGFSRSESRGYSLPLALFYNNSPYSGRCSQKSKIETSKIQNRLTASPISFATIGSIASAQILYPFSFGCSRSGMISRRSVPSAVRNFSLISR